MAYNLTAFNQSTYIGFTQQINTMVMDSHGVNYFAVILGVIFCVFFFGLMRKHSAIDALLASSFICILAGVMFVFAGLITFTYIYILLGMLIGAIIFKMISEYK